MKVGVVVQSDFPNISEVRPRKLAKKATESGHGCAIFARETGREREPVDYATVRRFAWFSNVPVLRLVTARIPFNPFWILWLMLEYRRTGVDVVVGSDIRAGMPAIVAARLTRTPVVLDLQENNPDRQRLVPIESLSHYVTRCYRVIYAMEMFCIRAADEVWVVVKERKADLRRKGVPERKLTVVSNTPLLSEFESSDGAERDYEWDGFTLVYVGGIQRLRGLDLAVRAVPHVREAGEDVTVVIGGFGDQLPELKRLRAELGVEDAVHFPGVIDWEDFPEFLGSGDVGLILNDVNEAHNVTIPNKLFDYMLFELPVLATDLDPVTRIIRETDCGRSLSADPSPEEVADAILRLKQEDPLERMGKNGRAAVEERYNWDREWERIAASLERVTG